MISLGFRFGLVCFRVAFALVSFGFAWLALWSRLLSLGVRFGLSLISLGFRFGLVWFRLAFALVSIGFAWLSL